MNDTDQQKLEKIRETARLERAKQIADRVQAEKQGKRAQLKRTVARIVVQFFAIVAIVMGSFGWFANKKPAPTGIAVAENAATPVKPVVLTRAEKIRKQFSAWDGHHYELQAWVKRQMNDPDSYEHIESRYYDLNDGLIVILKFRGKNAFGGLIVDSVKAKVSPETGQVIEVFK